jgi:alpha-1,3-rhamnosyltransferase
MDQENMPLVTAVIPVYNHEKYVGESIRSILRQSYRNVELIVINDGSKDHSNEIILTLIEECRRRFTRFEYINRDNLGLSATLNQALGMARGKYFSVLASDDIALPEKFSLLVNALESADNTCAAAFGNALFINDTGQTIDMDVQGNSMRSGEGCANFLDFHTKLRTFDYRSNEFGSYPTLLADNYLPAMSNVVKTKSIKEVGGWTVGCLVEDWEMWLKLSKQYKFLFVDRPAALYRLHGMNSCSNVTHKLIHSSLILVSREKEYCIQNRLMQIWRNSFYNQLFQLLRNREVPRNEKIRELMSAEVLSLMFFLLRKGGNKFSRELFHKS